MDIVKIFGPPGSGKTTYLLGIVEKELEQGTPPENIGYFSFTRKASEEAKSRAIKRFPQLNAKQDFPYFRTLHSLAFLCVNARRDDILQPEHYKEFGRLVGIDIKLSPGEDGVLKVDSDILNEINLARIRDTDLRTHYNLSNLDIEWFHLEFVERSYRKFKEERNLLDFTDLLINVIKDSTLLPALDAVIIDEAQDLSRLQWEMVELLAKKSKRVFLAGDDDQAIFRWAGSSVEGFLEFEGHIKILEQSYRVPQKIHDLADSIITKITHRQAKTWKAREYDGIIHHYPSFEYAPVTEGEWLILAATNYMLQPVQEWLRGLGMLFEYHGSLSMQRPILEAVYGWEKLRKGQSITGEHVETVYRYMGPDCIARGHKKFKSGDPQGMYDLATLTKDHGLLTDKPWMEALEKIGLERSAYLSSMLRRGSRFEEGAKIKVSTIHGAKGGEADNVLLITDISPKFMQEFAQNDADMRRLLYVGLTRTRKALHLVMPRDRAKSFPIKY